MRRTGLKSLVFPFAVGDCESSGSVDSGSSVSNSNADSSSLNLLN